MSTVRGSTENMTLRTSTQSLLQQFRVHEVLDDDPSSKTIWLLGSICSCCSRSQSKASCNAIPGETAAVVTLERLSFSVQTISNTCIGRYSDSSNCLLLSSLALETAEHNDIYSWATGFINDRLFKPDIRVSLIYPATQKHIDKHRFQQRRWIKETPQLYSQITKTYIESQPASRIQWVYNILAKKTESDRIIFEDPDPVNGFIILPDLKWDVLNSNSMYLVAIVHRRDIKSLRDLTRQHLPLLKNIEQKSQNAAQKYGVPSDQLCLYVHYQPSYYHFHVHITNVNFESRGMHAGRAHLLDTIIYNIESISESYYQNAILPFVLGSNNDLWRHWKSWENASTAVNDI
ncbi:hypothetical protein EV179_000870 [Coemansia sp. RSA 487]|nr:hypothetical protein EV179_000870 [Coemansia sp. RSA 487]